jgi:hypothetical protein
MHAHAHVLSLLSFKREYIIQFVAYVLLLKYKTDLFMDYIHHPVSSIEHDV